jgi:hypothetical protein
MPHTLTILRTLGPSLAKTWLADGTISDYDSARQYHPRSVGFDGVAGLHQVLTRLAGQPRECIVRGVLQAEAKKSAAPVLRRLDVFEDAPSPLFMVDVDNWELEDGEPIEQAIEGFIEKCLPECFQGTSYVWQLSGSMGHPTKVGQLRAHLWFLLEEPMTCAEAEAWAKLHVPAADHTVHRCVQVNYTAEPVRHDGAPADPHAGHRLGLVQGMFDTVIVPDDMPVPAVTTHVERGSRATGMVDPRGKAGIIGALCRAYSPYDLPTLFPDVFARGSKPERLTWLAGGGSAEGCRVTDDGQHLYNSHATSPIGGHAANLFDTVRTHVFGHLDADIDPDVIEFEPNAAPSYRAALDWARTLPEVSAELDPSTPAAAEKAEAVIEEVRDAAAERELANAGDAEERVSNLEQRIAAAPTILHLKTHIARELAKNKSISPEDRERIAIRMQRRTKDIEGKALPISLVRGWLEPARVDPDAAFPDVGPEGEILGTIENLEVLCGRLSVTMHYDVIRKTQDILAPGMAYIRDQKDNASFAWLQSAAAKVRMPHNANQLKGYVCEICARNPYNPVLEWIESTPWDGRERVDELMATVTLAPDFDAATARKILRKWLIQAVAAAASPVPLQTRGVLVFTGEQYLGKSRWVKALLPGHEDLAILGRQIDPHNKDTIKIAISHWIAELGEIDATFKRADQAALKAFLSNDEDAFRLPYAPAESKFQRRTVFVASVNGEEVLLDDTGSTRYWCLPVTAMNHEHRVDMQQVWAEVLEAWRLGEQHWFERDEMAAVTRSNRRFETSDPVEETLRTRFDWSSPRDGSGDALWVWRTATEIAGMCGLKPERGTLSRLGSLIKKITHEPSKSDGDLRRRRVPIARTECRMEELPQEN